MLSDIVRQREHHLRGQHKEVDRHDVHEGHRTWLCQELNIQDSDPTVDAAQPNVFVTVAPGENRFPLHHGMFQRFKRAQRLSEVQALLTLHFHAVLNKVLNDFVLGESGMEHLNIKEVLHRVCRVEFQRRGTLHVHLCAWVCLVDCIPGIRDTAKGRTLERMLTDALKQLFNDCCIDVQVGMSTEKRLKYVTGYEAKAHDSLTWKSQEWDARPTGNHLWRTCYRLLLKKAPLGPEMACELSGLPLMLRSFNRHFLYVQVLFVLYQLGPICNV